MKICFSIDQEQALTVSKQAYDEGLTVSAFSKRAVILHSNSLKRAEIRPQPDRVSEKLESQFEVLPLLEEIKQSMQEHFMVLTLNVKNQVIAKRVVFKGSLSSSIIHPREVFVDAISDRAAAIIIAHNHPSGDLTPSQEDNHMTKRLQDAGDIIGIKILDHIIVARDNSEHFSYTRGY